MNLDKNTDNNHSLKKPQDAVAAQHDELRLLFGLDKSVEDRGKFSRSEKSSGLKAITIIVLALVLIAGCIGMWIWGQREVMRQEEAAFIAKKQHDLEAEIARRNQIEYADIAFLDSFPPNVDITMDGKKLYARGTNGGYTELRARESTWIQNLPVKESTVIQFGFEAEGFHPMTRSVAYYDWFPSHKPTGNTLQKIFRKIVLEPDVTPVVSDCAQLPPIGDANPCDWTVFREIVFREKYASAVSPLQPDEAQKRKVLKSLFVRQPLLLQAARGFDSAALDTNQPIPDPELPDATKTLLKALLEQPYALYGAITVETDSPDTRVFFMGEPLMLVKETGSMAQVKVQPDAPYTFAVYGQGRPIRITDTLSVRLETDGAPPFVTEISPHQWHCTVPPLDQVLAVPAPELDERVNMPDFRHYLCTYSLKISVKFEEIKALEAEAAKQRSNDENKKAAEGGAAQPAAQ